MPVTFDPHPLLLLAPERFQPPLTTDEATAMNGLAILKEVFDLVEREAWWKA